MAPGAVVLVVPSAKAGGAERAVAGLAQALPAFGFRPRAVLLEHGPLEGWLAGTGCDVLVWPAPRVRQLAGTTRLIREIRALLVDCRPAAVLSNGSKAHVYGGLAAIGLGCPAFWWQHGNGGWNAIDFVASRIPAAAVACAGAAGLRAQRRLSPRRRLVQIPPGVAVDAIAARVGEGRAVRAAAGWDGHPVIGVVGRLQPWKGQHVFLEAAALVARSHPEVRFAVVGGAVLGWEGDYPDELRRLADRLGVADRVRFTGHHDDVYPWIDALDIVVHASDNEPFGLVLVEAMALGKPLVATSSAGPRQIVEDGRSGLLVPAGDPEAMAAALRRVLDDPSLAAAMSAAGPDRARLFSDATTAARFADLFRSVAARAR